MVNDALLVIKEGRTIRVMRIAAFSLELAKSHHIFIEVFRLLTVTHFAETASTATTSISKKTRQNDIPKSCLHTILHSTLYPRFAAGDPAASFTMSSLSSYPPSFLSSISSPLSNER